MIFAACFTGVLHCLGTRTNFCTVTYFHFLIFSTHCRAAVLKLGHAYPRGYAEHIKGVLLKLSSEFFYLIKMSDTAEKIRVIALKYALFRPRGKICYQIIYCYLTFIRVTLHWDVLHWKVTCGHNKTTNSITLSHSQVVSCLHNLFYIDELCDCNL